MRSRAHLVTTFIFGAISGACSGESRDSGPRGLTPSIAGARGNADASGGGANGAAITTGGAAFAGSSPEGIAGNAPAGSTGPGERRACKRGMAYGHHSPADFAALSPASAWWYNWHFRPDTELGTTDYAAQGVEYVPMVWGRDFDAAELESRIPNGARWLLGFNEPNFGEQSNLSAIEAAALWPEVERLADARGLLLVSPAVNFCGGNCKGTNPFDYLDDFFAACAGCRVDRVAFHIYVGCNARGENRAEWLINHVKTYKERFSLPLWLTEFACTDASSWDDQVAFLEDALEYLENEPRIERYAWFSGRFQGIPFVDLLGADGALTPLGQAYVNAPKHRDCSE